MINALRRGRSSMPGGGGVAAPEASPWAMMIIGFFGLGAVLRRRLPRIVTASPQLTD
jgi:hypothetical protein